MTGWARASAPGKLMLAGEYSVLSPGGVALGVTVGRQVSVEVHTDEQRTDWCVNSPLMGLEGADPAQVPVVEAALAAGESWACGGSITIHSELGGGPGKLGLGSSSAVCVATYAALRAAHGLSSPGLSEAVAVHREAQRGVGSGYDVATTMTGGVCLYHHGSKALSAERLLWPSGLVAAVLHTGHGSSSPGMLARIAAWEALDAESHAASQAKLHERALRVVAAWRSGVVEEILDACAGAQEALNQYDQAGQIGLDRGRHGELMTAIEDAGALGRTAGAGGGDCVWALASDKARVDAAVRAALDAGFAHVELEFPAQGLRVLTGDGEAGD